MMFFRILFNLLFLTYLRHFTYCNTRLPTKKGVLKKGLIPYQYHYIINANFTLPPGPIYAKGWLKYYSYLKSDPNKLNDFFKNFAFYEQFKGGVVKNLNLGDQVCRFS